MMPSDPRPCSCPEPCPLHGLPHERLHAWQVALDLDREVVALLLGVPRGLAWLADQAARASGSAVLNLAEAMGRSGADRARTLRIAAGSVLEVSASIQLLGHRRAGAEPARARVRALCGRLSVLIAGLIRRAEGGGAGSP
ncbi:MAG: four helix bundle protein [Planctomycetales bacterium]|nr:four helix bundle protein [Planctomycetales bacterium]